MQKPTYTITALVSCLGVSVIKRY